MRIVEQITLGAAILLVASPAVAGDASIDREAALARTQEGTQAQEGAPATEQASVTGSVVEVSDTHLVLETPQGDEKSFEVSPATEIRRGASQVTISDVNAGEPASVRAKSSGGELVATSISLPSKASSSSY
jgi:hypothetical protein